MRKKEIIYNSESLVSVWLDGKEVKDLEIVLEGENITRNIPTTVESCGKTMGKVLSGIDKTYSKLKVVGFVEGQNQTLGEIDIK